ncbi:hypothetical protein BT69DRAFT_1345086 [Atractiella rhizophila]|nr:hypothetical protein BT69DRAFT_1345086 [Atractiella rhizophila]
MPVNFRPLQRNLPLGEQLDLESAVVVLEDLRPNIDIPEVELSPELTTYNAADWKDENSIKTWMDELYRVALKEKSRYSKGDPVMQLSENPSNRDSSNGILVHHEINPPVKAYSNISLALEFRDELQCAASDGNTQLARNAAYTLGARPRCFVWTLLIDTAGDNHYSWVNSMRGGHFQGKPKLLEDHFKEVAQIIAQFAKASEEQIGFLNIFDHDPAWHFTWEVGSCSRTEEPDFTNYSSDSRSRVRSPSVRVPSVQPASSSATTPSSTMLLPYQFVPSPNHKFKLDLNGCLNGWHVVGNGSEFMVNWVQEILFRSYSIAGRGTQVWICELDGGGYGIIKHVWLTEDVLERLQEHVKQFNGWRELWKDQPPRKLDGSPADATDLEWLRHAPRVILSQPNLSTIKILSKNALWNDGDVSEVMETDLIPVLIYHSTAGFPLSSAKCLDDVLDAFKGVLTQLAILHDHDFIHRDVSYANIFIREFQTDTGGRNALVVGWLNDFDFSIRKEKNRGKHASKPHPLSGTFQYLSRCVLRALMTKDAAYEQSVMDDVESVIYCVINFFCNFYLDTKRRMVRRDWSRKLDTPTGEGSGRTFSGSKDLEQNGEANERSSAHQSVKSAKERSSTLHRAKSAKDRSPTLQSAKSAEEQSSTIHSVKFVPLNGDYPLQSWLTLKSAFNEKLLLLNTSKPTSLPAFTYPDWKDENSIKTWMDELYRVARKEKSRYSKGDPAMQLSENPSNRDSSNGILVHHEINPPVKAYSNISLALEFRDELQCAASDGNTQLARNAAYTLGARPRCFVWTLLIDTAGDNHYSWVNSMRGGHFQGKPKLLEDHFKEVAQIIAQFAKASEEQIGFLNIFDHDPAWHFTWEVGSCSRTEEPGFTNYSSDSRSRVRSPSVRVPSVQPASSSATTPSSTMLLPYQFVPSPNHKFKLDLNGCLNGWHVVGNGSEFMVNWVQEILFRSYSIAGRGTQVWICELDGGGYGIIKHVWLTEDVLERLQEHVKQFNGWRELWKDQPPRKLDGSPADATDLEWLRHAPRLILSQPNLSTIQILSKNALWNDGDVSEVMETDLIPVLIYHSTAGFPLSSAKCLDDVLDAFKGVLTQLAILHDHDFIHRDVSYANIFIREFQTDTGGGNALVVGWLNDFDFSIRKEKNRGKHASKPHPLSGTFQYLSRCVLRALMTKDAAYEQSVMDDVESVIYCVINFFCNFYLDTKRRMVRRDWSRKPDTPTGEGSGRTFSGSKDLEQNAEANERSSAHQSVKSAKERSSTLHSAKSAKDRSSTLQSAKSAKEQSSTIHSVKFVPLNDDYPLQSWLTLKSAFNEKLLLLNTSKPTSLPAFTYRLRQHLVDDGRWSHDHVTRLLWELTRPLQLQLEDIENGIYWRPLFPDGCDEKAVVKDIVGKMVDALERGKKRFNGKLDPSEEFDFDPTL